MVGVATPNDDPNRAATDSDASGSGDLHYQSFARWFGALFSNSHDLIGIWILFEFCFIDLFWFDPDFDLNFDFSVLKCWNKCLFCKAYFYLSSYTLA